MKKKILQICAIELSVHALLKPLLLESQRHGYEVHVACTNEGGFDSLMAQGFIMHDINIDRSINLKGNLRSVKMLASLMRKEKFDIVHVHTPIAALLGRAAAKLAGMKNIIYTAHGYYFHDEMSPKQYKFYYNIEKYSAKFMTDWLLLQSKEDYELSINDKFKSNDKIIHLSNGVDIWNKFNLEVIPNTTKDIANTIPGLQIQKGDIVFSFIGRLVKEKGVFELINAFTQLREKHKNIKLLIIGDLPPSERDIETYEKLQRLLSAEDIYAVGFRKDIPQLMKLSSVFILPSYREGLPRSIIEAMALEKPIIATNIRGCREEVFDNVNGYLVEKENSQSLKLAMEKFIQQPELIEIFGQKSREIVEELFDEQKVIQKQIELFAKLVK